MVGSSRVTTITINLLVFGFELVLFLVMTIQRWSFEISVVFYTSIWFY